MAGVRLPFEVTQNTTCTPGSSSGRDFADWGLNPGANFYGTHPDVEIIDEKGSTRPITCENVNKEMCVKACGLNETCDLRTKEAFCGKCGKVFEVENVYFYKCKWKTLYQKRVKVGNLTKLLPIKPEFTADEESGDNEFKKFVPSDYQLYSELVIHTRSR